MKFDKIIAKLFWLSFCPEGPQKVIAIVFVGILMVSMFAGVVPKIYASATAAESLDDDTVIKNDTLPLVLEDPIGDDPHLFDPFMEDNRTDLPYYPPDTSRVKEDYENVSLSSTTIYVPDDYTTIQAAVDGAITGDTMCQRWHV
ncbi:MAG: hypothetical protein SVM80_08900 [Halobacteriota archaeon]|nr:hypothetical protein [Halobacteriota archaeon]